MKKIIYRGISFLLILLFGISAVSCNEKKEPDTTGTGILVGKEGWLFSEYTNTSSELEDYQGSNLFSETELAAIAQTLKSKMRFFAKDNTDFVFALLPNKMTIYDEYLKEETAQTKGTQTRRTQVLAYLEENARLQTVDVTDALLAAKAETETPLYNMTDSALTEWGAYVAYKEIIKKTNALTVGKIRVPEASEYDISTKEEEGKALAVKLNVEKEYTNQSVSMKYKEAIPYVDVEINYENIWSTKIEKENQKEDFRYLKAILYSNEDLDVLKPFFSLSFSSIGFKKGFDTDAILINKIKPNVAIFAVSEKELASLLVDTSEDARMVLRDPNVSTAPVITGTAFADETHLAIVGIAEEGATVHAIGGKEEVAFLCSDGTFLLDVEVGNGASTLSITATTKDKKESEVVEVPVTDRMERNNKGTFLGKEGHLHINETAADYLGVNLLPQDQLNNIKKRLERQLKKIQEVSPNTEVIYIIPPNHLTVYPETAPDWLVAQNQNSDKNSKMKQIIDCFKDSPVTILNLEENIVAHKSDEYLLYQKTDTHWNELGAYYGYEALMQYIAQKYPAAAPVPLSQFEIFKKSVPGGDMLNFLGMNLDIARENSVFVRPTFSPVIGIEKDFRMNFENIWFSDYREFKIDNPDLPTMVMYRDSFSTNLMTYLAENFRHSVFNSMWDYSINMEWMQEMQPDYIIIEMVERNLGQFGS